MTNDIDWCKWITCLGVLTTIVLVALALSKVDKNREGFTIADNCRAGPYPKGYQPRVDGRVDDQAYPCCKGYVHVTGTTGKNHYCLGHGPNGVGKEKCLQEWCPQLCDAVGNSNECKTWCSGMCDMGI